MVFCILLVLTSLEVPEIWHKEQMKTKKDKTKNRTLKPGRNTAVAERRWLKSSRYFQSPRDLVVKAWSCKIYRLLQISETYQEFRELLRMGSKSKQYKY